MTGETREIAQDDAAAGVETSLRTCIATRAQLPPEQMLRFVAAPDGAITPDVARRLPGRGVWVTCDRSALAAAIRSKAFNKSLRRPVEVRDDLPDLVDRLLARRALDALSLANKAGLLVAGFAKVDKLVSRGDAAALVHAADASDDGIDKLDRRFRALCRDLEQPAPIVRDFTNEQLSLAIGRPNVVHAALERGGATSNFLIEADRLARFRSRNHAPEGSLPEAAGPMSS